MTTTIRSQQWLRLLAIVTTIAITGLATNALAQSPPPDDENWQHGTTVMLFGGGATASSESDPAAGIALGWEVSHHLTVEGRGVWFDTNPGSTGFTALLGARMPLMPARRFNPFVAGSVGMFRATFDSSVPNDEIPEFYRSRIEPGSPHAGTFNDFVVALGGGADFFLNEHFALRPEVSALIVTGNSDSRTVAMYGLTLAYHFEAHPTNLKR